MSFITELFSRKVSPPRRPAPHFDASAIMLATPPDPVILPDAVSMLPSVREEVRGMLDIFTPEVSPERTLALRSVPPQTHLLEYRVAPRLRETHEDIIARAAASDRGIVYDFDEIRRVEDKESFLSISFRKHIEAVLKRGWTVRGKNPEWVNHIRTRLWEIFILTNRSPMALLRQIVADLVRFSNAFIVARRSNDYPISGKPYRFQGQDMDPIVGLFRVDPASLVPEYSKTSTRRLIGWRQRHHQLMRYPDYLDTGPNAVLGGSRFFPLKNIFHIKWNDKGLLIGTPFVIPVLDDIRAFRRIEEFVELLAAKAAFPLYHYTVGTKEAPADVHQNEDGTVLSEVQRTVNLINMMPTEGCWVTSERHSIEIVEPKNSNTFEKYLEHFENRVISGIGLSGISLGRASSANRSTAQIIDRALNERAQDIQQILVEQLMSTLFLHLHLDAQKSFGADDMAHIYFPPVDQEDQRAHENHVLNQYNSNVLTREEVREELGRAELDENEEKDRSVEQNDVYLQRRYAELAEEFGYLTTMPGIKMPSATGGGSSGGGGAPKKASSKTSKAAKKTTASKVQPTNQAGKLATKSRYTANSVNEEFRQMKYMFASLNERDIEINVPHAAAFIAHTFKRVDDTLKERIWNDLSELFSEKNMPLPTMVFQKCYDEVRRILLQEVQKECIIKVTETDEQLFPIFDEASHRVTTLVNSLPDRYQAIPQLKGLEDGQATTPPSPDAVDGLGGREQVPPVHGQAEGNDEGQGVESGASQDRA